MPFKIVRNDITRMYTDAIVNTANPRPVIGGGTDRAVYEAAGREDLLKERIRIGAISPGEARATQGFRLPARYIIHTVGPVWRDGNHGEIQTLWDCYWNSLSLARDLGCRSISFPLISTGVYGFPKPQALMIAVRSIGDFLKESVGEDEDMEVILVVFDRESFQLSSRIRAEVRAFIDEHYVSAAREAEYGSSFQESPDFRGTAANERFAGTTSLSDALSGPESDLDMESEDWLEADEEETEDAVLRRDFLQDDRSMMQSPVGAPPAESLKDKARRRRVSAPSFSCARNSSKMDLESMKKALGETFQEKLFELIDARGMTDPEVYKGANVSRKLFSKIRGNRYYQPRKSTVLAFAVSMRLDMEETADLLSRAGFAFSPSSLEDLVVASFIRNSHYDINELNLYLFDAGLPQLGS